jgi:hypothetical protein
LFVNTSSNLIESGGINGLTRFEFDPQKVLDSLASRASGGISYTRTKPDPYEPVKFPCYGGIGGFFRDRVGKYPCPDLLQLFRLQMGIYGQDPDHPDMVNLKSELPPCLTSDTGAFSIHQLIF